ncbi:MAG: amidohydrolase family protein [Chloroflexi bacterium OLB15]|nr:MAG: amidohydrolase family protein [Chloroflexi bacterium OLB15]
MMTSSPIIEHILHNGNIAVEPGSPLRIQALAIGGGRILAAGSDAEILPLARPGTKIENLNGALVVPGMIDAHIHWKAYAESLHMVQLFGMRSKEEALTQIASYAATRPAGEWITGYGWAQDEWDVKEFPSRHDLDAVLPDHPVFLRSRSGHAVWCNTRALQIAGVTAETAVPVGSEVKLDASGQPAGILLEWDAMLLVDRHIPVPTIETLATQMIAAQDRALSLGITAIHDFDDQESLAALQVLREREELALRAVKNINKPYFDSLLHLGLRRGFGDDWLRIGALKLFADGAIGPHTAYMIEPYIGEPDNYGIVVVDKEEMLDLVTRATSAGISSTVHAIGDRAVHDVLDVYESLRRFEAANDIPRASRPHRVEHVQLIHPSDVNRLAELDLIASMQPIHATSDYEVADRVWGAARVPYSYNPRLQLDRGVTVAFGSDAPYDRIGTMVGIHAAVTRHRADGSPGADGWTPEARITVDQAVRGFTIGAATAVGMESRQGRLLPGFLADLVVLDRDIYAISPDEIVHTNVTATMVGGQWRFGGLN